MIIDPILPGGPSITHREIECVADAAAIGWNMNRNGYIRKFQARFSGLTGQKYAFATSSGTEALHLALLGLGIGPGCEVILPEIADISLAWSVVFTGARPVFCDVDSKSLCISPESAEARVSTATRAIIASHLYGQMCDMDALTSLAGRRGIYLVEDATQGIGGSWKGRPAGSFGAVAAFSFNGEEALVTGEGGMLVTSDERVISRAVRLGSLGRSASNPFVYEEPGFNYAMSNLQAALGVAQTERLEELVEKKRRIFGWYSERLDHVPGLRLNHALPQSASSHLMTMLMLEDPSIVRTEFLNRLAASKVIARPVFYPLSSMPSFVNSDNPVAFGQGARAILLPSGHNRTEDEIEYVSSVIKVLLGDRRQKSARVEPTGWLKYKSDLLEKLRKIKEEGLSLPFGHDGESYELRAITAEDAKKPEVIRFMADFRRHNKQAFLRHFEITDDYVERTMDNYLEKALDFVLFFVAEGQRLFGHMGLDSFDFQKKECVAEAFMMKPDAPRGLAAAASDAMYQWAARDLGIVRVYNHVVGSNRPVKLLAASQGFREINRTALYKKELPGGAVFRPMYIQGHDKPDEYFVFSAKDLDDGHANTDAKNEG